MGWCSGTEIYEEMMPAIRAMVPKENRVDFHKAMITAFENHDWDCQDDLRGTDMSFDTALGELHPDWDEEDD